MEYCKGARIDDCVNFKSCYDEARCDKGRKIRMKFSILRSLAAITILGLVAAACGDLAKQDGAGKTDAQNLIIYTGRDKDEIGRASCRERV